MVCPIKKIVFTELEHPFFVAIHRQLITTAFWQCLSMSLLTDEKVKQTDSYNSKTSKCTRQKLLVLVVVIDLLLVLLLGSSFWLWLAITHKVDDRKKKAEKKMRMMHGRPSSQELRESFQVSSTQQSPSQSLCRTK